MTSPRLYAELDNGDFRDDPSEEDLFELFEDVEDGEALWVIVERVDDRTGQTYAQAHRNQDGSYLVERRCGTPQTHESTTAPNMETAHQLLTRWAFAL